MSQEPRNFVDLDRLFNPKTVSIVGIKPNIQYGAVLDNMLAGNFPNDRLTLVNPFHPEVKGIPCIPEVPVGTDVAFLLLRSSLVPDVIQELIDRKVGAAVVVASGFAERGADGIARQERLAQLGRNIVICGPNTMGAGNLATGSVLFGGSLPKSLKPGNVAAVFQSGGMTNLFLQLADARGIGVGKFVVTGNEVGATTADYINYLVGDPETTTIALYFESVQNGRLLRQAVVNAHRAGKRLVALVAGRTEPSRATVATHSGNIAAGLRWLNILEGLGVVVVSTFDELVETVTLFSTTPAFRRPSVQLLTVSGGESTWMTDLAHDVGITLPAISPALRSRLSQILGRDNFVGNPMDIGGLLRGPNPQQFGEVVAACCEDSDSDVVGFRLNLPPKYDESLADAYRQCKSAVSRSGRVCVFFTRASETVDGEWREFFRELGSPLLQEIRRSLRAIALRARVESLELGEFTDSDGSALVFAPGSHMLGDLRPVLESFGLRTVFEAPVSTLDDLLSSMKKVDGPVVMKLESSELLHKTEAKAVIMDISDDDAATAAFHQLNEVAEGLHLRDAKIVIQEQISNSAELLVGGSNDEEMGPVIIVSHGGLFAELFTEPSVRPAPVSEKVAKEMVQNLQGSKVLSDYRGLGSCDLDAVARAISRFSKFIAECAPPDSQWDLNPVMVQRGVEGDRAVVIVDALGLIRSSEAIKTAGG